MKKHDNAIYILHIRDAIESIEQFVIGVTEDQFLNSKLISSAVIRQLEIIGEASRYVSEDIKDKYPDIPWRIIKDMRNILIHEYFGVDLKAVWDTLEEDMPYLKKHILKIIDMEELKK